VGADDQEGRMISAMCIAYGEFVSVNTIPRHRRKSMELACGLDA